MDFSNTNSLKNYPLVLTVPQLADVLHVGRNSAYALVNSGAIRSMNDDRKRLAQNMESHFFSAESKKQP